MILLSFIEWVMWYMLGIGIVMGVSIAVILICISIIINDRRENKC